MSEDKCELSKDLSSPALTPRSCAREAIIIGGAPMCTYIYDNGRGAARFAGRHGDTLSPTPFHTKNETERRHHPGETGGVRRATEPRPRRYSGGEHDYAARAPSPRCTTLRDIPPLKARVLGGAGERGAGYRILPRSS